MTTPLVHSWEREIVGKVGDLPITRWTCGRCGCQVNTTGEWTEQMIDENRKQGFATMTCEEK